MKITSLLFLSALTALVESKVERPPRKSTALPNRFIIELKEPEGLTKRADDPKKDVDDLFKGIAALKIKTSSSVNFTSDVFIGTSVTLTNRTEIQRISTLPNVKKIYPVRTIQREPLKGKAATDPPTGYNVHEQTGVQKLHDKGIYGQGVIVAVVDTGVDYKHPDLGGGFGPGFKIEGGADLVGDGATDANVPDSDPFETCDGHGTHVTGILAGNSTKFLGVAPQARIRVYKTISCQGGGSGLTDDLLIAAHIRAYEDGADVITTSIGDELGWPNSAWASASDRIAKKGVFVLSAGGNSGQAGAFLASADSTGGEVIAVAASRAQQLPAIQAIVTGADGVEFKIPYISQNGKVFGDPIPGWEKPKAKTGMNLWSPTSPENTEVENPDGCFEFVNEYPYPRAEELLDRVGLIKLTSNCTIRQQARNLVRKGCLHMLLWDDKNAPFIPIVTQEDPIIQEAMLPSDVGAELDRRMRSNETLIIKFPDATPLVGVNLPTAGTVDSYSSWGLANDLSIKPDISAPGSDIFSTWPEGQYLIASGTSMATPYAAGVVALYLSANGGGRSKNKSKRELRDAALSLANRGNPVRWTDVDGNIDLTVYAPVAQQGGGLIDAFKFANSKVQFSPSKLALNHTGNFKSKTKVTLTNTGSKTLNFNITHQPGLSFYAYEEDYMSIETLYPEHIYNKSATVKFSTTTLQLAPGGKKSVDIDFTAPTGFVNLRAPIYGGHIVFQQIDGSNFYVPYSGMAIDGKTLYQPGAQDGQFWNWWTEEDIQSPVTLNLQNDIIVPEVDVRFGVRQAIVELVLNSTYTSPGAFKLPRVPGQNGYVGQLADRRWISRSTAYKLPERLWVGSGFTNGTTVPNGVYRYVIRVLKPFFEDENSLDSWSYTVSPAITIVSS